MLVFSSPNGRARSPHSFVEPGRRGKGLFVISVFFPHDPPPQTPEGAQVFLGTGRAMAGLLQGLEWGSGTSFPPKLKPVTIFFILIFIIFNTEGRTLSAGASLLFKADHNLCAVPCWEGSLTLPSSGRRGSTARKTEKQGNQGGELHLARGGGPLEEGGRNYSSSPPPPPPCYSRCRWILGIMGIENNRLNLKGTAVFFTLLLFISE